YNAKISRPFIWSIALPAGAVALFGTLFVLANPDLVTAVSRYADRWFTWLDDWVRSLSQNWREIGFWLAAGYVAIGLLRPLLRRSVTDAVAPWMGSAVTPYSTSHVAIHAPILEPM